MKRNPESHKLRVFLCHSSGDKPLVRELYKQLRRDRFEPWLDEEDLLPGQNWEQEIPKAVRKSDVIIVCLSRSSISKSGYVQKEIKLALDVANEQPEGTIFLIPLRLEECEFPEQFKRWQGVNLYEEGGYKRLWEALRYRAATLKINTQPPTDRANHSTSTSIKIPGPNKSDNQLSGLGLKVYPAASQASLWKLSSALLILLLVATFLSLNRPTPSPPTPPTLGIEVQTDGFEIRNTNDYPIVHIDAYLTAYKVNKVQRLIIRELSVPISERIDDNLAPKQIVKILNEDLIRSPDSTRFAVPPNSDEIVIQALVIVFRREKGGENFVAVKPFSSTDAYGQIILSPLNAINKDVDLHLLDGVLRVIEDREEKNFGDRLSTGYR